MDRPPLSKIIPFECEVCERVLRKPSRHDEEALERAVEGWRLHRFDHAQGTMQIMTCPECSHLSDARLLLCHVRRIRSGKNLSYH